MSTSLNLSDRFYKYIKYTSINNVYTAIVELLTNSIDAYNRTIHDNIRRVNIIIDASDHSMIIVDNASGITKENLIKCFGQVGEYTSTEGSRGFFSKGAKDVSAVGDMYIVSIKDDLIASCELRTDNTFILHNPDTVLTPTYDERKKYMILDRKDGLYIKVKFNQSFKLPPYEDILKIQDYYSIRDIFAGDKNDIVFKYISTEGKASEEIKLKTKHLDIISETLFDETFQIPNYENITARFKIYKKKDEYVKQDDYSSFMYHGVLIKDDSAIYDINTFYNDIRSHPKIYSVYCMLETDGIQKMMYKFDAGEIGADNPFPILDPSRMGNLNKSHPFIKNLYSRPHKILKIILENMYSKEINNADKFDISEIFNNIDLFDDDFYKMLQSLAMPHRIKSVDRLVKYIKNTQEKVVSSEKTLYNSEDLLAEFEDHLEGKYQKNIPKFNIQFIHNEEARLYKIFIDNGVIHVIINVADYILSRYSSYENGHIKVIDKKPFLIALSEIVAEGFSFQMIKTNEIYDTEEKTTEEIETNFIKYRNIFSRLFYKFFIDKDILNFLS